MNGLLWLAGFIGAFTVFGPEPLRPQRIFGWRVRLSFAVLVTLVAFSPVIGLYLAPAFGYEATFVFGLGFAWASIAASLPLSLLVGTVIGRGTRHAYWDFLLASRQQTGIGALGPHSRNGVYKLMTVWTLVSFAIGMLLLAAS